MIAPSLKTAHQSSSLMRRKNELLETRGISAWCSRGDVYSAPVVRRGHTLCVVYHTGYTRLGQQVNGDLLHGQPGDIVDQLLLGIHVLLQTRIPRSHTIRRFQ